MSEGEADPVEFTIESQSQMKDLCLQNGASGLKNGTNRSVLKLEELVDNDTYNFVYDNSSGIRKLKKSVENQQGRLNNMTKAMEKQVKLARVPCVKFLDPHTLLLLSEAGSCLVTHWSVSITS